ncbi:hypothetical protein BOTBODRAFT_175271 [Botryobasidium botryosum FD-172 SS1]|uniref:Uncharacterized protein n=1 Tax=Botryobasidium botryosum (strain FD-172 SS1) TaxID=930990 RepID=A0A067MGQ4_BOTB1|nr:hypothetical protein BOTBODRAFT_175271 [Botryobasidium botryosum FD-172 SS1]
MPLDTTSNEGSWRPCNQPAKFISSNPSMFAYTPGNHPKFYISFDDMESDDIIHEPARGWGVQTFWSAMTTLTDAVRMAFRVPRAHTDSEAGGHMRPTAALGLSMEPRVVGNVRPITLELPKPPRFSTHFSSSPTFDNSPENSLLPSSSSAQRPATAESSSSADECAPFPKNSPPRLSSLDGRPPARRPLNHNIVASLSPPSPKSRASSSPAPPIRHIDFRSTVLGRTSPIKAPHSTAVYADASTQMNIREEVPWNSNPLGRSAPSLLPTVPLGPGPANRSPTLHDQDQSAKALLPDHSILDLPLLLPTIAAAEKVDLPAIVSEMKQLKIRGLDEWCYWVDSESSNALPSPLLDAADVKAGTLYLHRHSGHLQIWLRGISSGWTSVVEGARHPTLLRRSLLIRAGGQPSWIDKKTVSTYRTRLGKRRVESVERSADDAAEGREAKRRAQE